jgi:hypothetical protein
MPSQRSSTRMGTNAKDTAADTSDAGSGRRTPTDLNKAVQFVRILLEWDERQHRMSPSEAVIEGADDDGS